MDYSDRITFNPKQCGGRPCIRGLRIRVKDILEMLGGGMSEEEIKLTWQDELNDFKKKRSKYLIYE